MRALALDFDQRRLGVRDVPPPSRPGEREVVFRVREVGVCGTDRELASFLFGFPPDGDSFLVLGHEAVGQVTEVGSGVTALRPGDWVTPTIRRACSPPCASCAAGRRDLCLTGGYRERGIFGRHGYFTELAVDLDEDLIQVPSTLLDVAVLLEPLSVVEKAVSRALRLHDGEPRRAVVLGAGTIGILAALALQLRGLEVCVLSMEPRDHPRVRLLNDAGIPYSDGAASPTGDIVIEATGFREGGGRALASVAPLGVCAVLGAPDASGENLLRRLIINNQVLFGSVNSSPESFRQAVEDLARFDRRAVERLILRLAFGDYRRSILGPQGEKPKLVHLLE